MRIVFLGPPGVGKGTQAKRFAERHNLPHIATGDILRNAVKEGTNLGLQAKEYMLKGRLVPDNIIIEIMKERLTKEDCRKGVVLDGFPRTKGQAVALDEVLEEMGWKLDAVLYLTLQQDAIVERISGRRVCSKCGANYHIKYIPPKISNVCDLCGGLLITRTDDNKTSILQRLAVYEKDTTELISYYKEQNLLREISADGNPDEIANSIESLWHQ